MASGTPVHEAGLFFVELAQQFQDPFARAEEVVTQKVRVRGHLLVEPDEALPIAREAEVGR